MGPEPADRQRSADAARPADPAVSSDRFLGYGRQTIDERDVEDVVAALRSDHLTQGPRVPAFEEALERATGAAHAVCTSSGTAALHLALLVLGIGRGSRVLTTANTFLASATAALHCGAEVDFVDVDPASANLDPERLADLLEAGAPVDAVVAVHFAGRACDLDSLLALKERFGFRLVVDACHALGGTARVDGAPRRVGEVEGVDAAALSFHPVKPITTGEGGAVLLADPELAARARRLREHGVERGPRAGDLAAAAGLPRGVAPMVELGYNYRLPDVLAALGTAQLARLGETTAARRRLAERYDERLAGCEKPELDPGHAWHLYVVRVGAEERDGLADHLRSRGIGTQLHYAPVPLHPGFAGRFAPERFPAAVDHARRSLSLPLYPTLSTADQDRVIAALAEWRT